MNGWIWVVIDVVGALLLGLALVYGVIFSARYRRSKAAQRQMDEATKRVYEAESRREARQ